eukprot:275912-Rhodomonas_salina.1
MMTRMMTRMTGSGRQQNGRERFQRLSTLCGRKQCLWRYPEAIQRSISLCTCYGIPGTEVARTVLSATRRHFRLGCHRVAFDLCSGSELRVCYAVSGIDVCCAVFQL